MTSWECMLAMTSCWDMSLRSEVLITPFVKFIDLWGEMWTGISPRSSVFCNFANCFDELVSSRKYPLERRVTFASLLPAAESSSYANLNGLRDVFFWPLVEMAIRYFGWVFSVVCVFGFLISGELIVLWKDSTLASPSGCGLQQGIPKDTGWAQVYGYRGMLALYSRNGKKKHFCFPSHRLIDPWAMHVRVSGVPPRPPEDPFEDMTSRWYCVYRFVGVGHTTLPSSRSRGQSYVLRKTRKPQIESCPQ